MISSPLFLLTAPCRQSPLDDEYTRFLTNLKMAVVILNFENFFVPCLTKTRLFVIVYRCSTSLADQRRKIRKGENMLKRTLALTVAVMGLALCAGPMDYWTPPKKKLIECGWSQTMGVERLCAAVKILEKHTPYQGVSIALSGRDEKGKKFATNFMFGPEHDSGRGPKVERWKYEYFKEDIGFLKKTKFTKFTDNFFWTNSRSGNVEWSDDHDWDIVCNNFGIIARIAKETGVKGIIFDGEFYGNKSKPIFSFLEKGRTADDMVALARKRGQQWGRAIFSNYPDIKLFLIFSFAWKKAQRATRS